WWLVAARAFQGFGGGIALPLGTALLFRAFPEEEQGLALGMLGVALVTAPALGPILGGWLVDQGLWHWIFFINVPIAAVGLTLASRFLVEWKRGHRGPVDLPGLVTEVIGFGAVLYGASIAADRGWTAPAVVLAFGVGLTGLVWFAFVELFVSADPLLDLRLYRKRIFLVASLVGYVSVIALFGAEFLLPVYLQSLRGYTALQTGFILLPLAVTAGITLPVAGRLYDRIGPRVLLAIGFSVLAVNTWQLSLLEADTTIRWIAFLLVLRGFALGMTVQTTFVTALSVVPLVEIARGSSLTNATRQVVQSIGVAVLATILASTLSPEVRAMSARIQGAEGVTTGPVAICDPEAVAAVASPLGGPDVAARAARACQESVGGFERAYRVTFYFALLALNIGVTLPGWPLAWGGRRSADRPPMVE
ncbi:MAG: DHA2 family efflux MFS transporter permease subunit, partial [Anaerolineae bacterium]